MIKLCSIPGCNPNCRRRCPDVNKKKISFFLFPSYKDECAVWLKANPFTNFELSKEVAKYMLPTLALFLPNYIQERYSKTKKPCICLTSKLPSMLYS